MKRRRERIGILGGTFNPPHIGHLVLAQDALERLRLDRVLWIPCARPPHKVCPDLAPARDRLAMVRAALRGHGSFEVSDTEIRRGGLSYAVDTVAELRQQRPAAELVFLIGSDSLPDLYRWRSIEVLLTLCRFAVFHRPGFPADGMKAEALRLPPGEGRRILRNVFRAHAVEVSSSEIRSRCARGKGFGFLVPPAVERYIASRQLYRAARRGKQGGRKKP